MGKIKMRNKRAKQIRKGLELPKKSSLQPTSLLLVGSQRVGIIDGINGDHRIEDRGVYQRFCDENLRLYRAVKKLYINDINVKHELLKDLSLSTN